MSRIKAGYWRKAGFTCSEALWVCILTWFIHTEVSIMNSRFSFPFPYLCSTAYLSHLYFLFLFMIRIPGILHSHSYTYSTCSTMISISTYHLKSITSTNLWVPLKDLMSDFSQLLIFLLFLNLIRKHTSHPTMYKY